MTTYIALETGKGNFNNAVIVGITLLGGERERVALLRTAVLEAEITLLDDPTANMDIENTL